MKIELDDLRGSVALVTGGSSGIGLAAVEVLLNRGAIVVSLSRRPSPLRHGQLTSFEVDFGGPFDTSRVVEDVLALHGQLDILVCAAGVMILDRIVNADPRDFERIMRINLTSVMGLVSSSLPALIDGTSGPRGCADIVLVGSSSGRHPTPLRAGYAASKAGLAAFAETLRQEVSSLGVRVTHVEPGLTATNLRQSNDPETLSDMERETPVLQGVLPLSAGDVAESIAWAVSRPPQVTISEISIIPTSQPR